MAAETTPRMMTTQEAAELLRMSVSFLAKSRLKGDGPRFRKIGRAVRYAEADVVNFLKQTARTSTSET